MTIFIESPWPWLLIGIVGEAALAVALLQTRRGCLLWAMAGVAVFVLLGLLVERFVVTDSKLVTRTLDAAVAGVKANDLNRVLACISPNSPKPRSEARWILDRVQVSDAYIRQLEITINRLTSPPTARAKFVAVGKGTDRKGEFPYETFMRRVVVDLRLEDGRWLATGYDVEDLQPPRP